MVRCGRVRWGAVWYGWARIKRRKRNEEGDCKKDFGWLAFSFLIEVGVFSSHKAFSIDLFRILWE